MADSVATKSIRVNRLSGVGQGKSAGQSPTSWTLSHAANQPHSQA